MKDTPWPLLALIGASGVLSIGLMSLGYHPFDFIGARVWSYVGGSIGLTEIYILPGVSSAASDAWAGVPYAPPLFPYGATLAYFFSAIGLIQKLLFPPPDIWAGSLGVLIKTALITFSLLDGLMIYKIARRLGSSSRSALLFAGLFLMNPMTMFVGAVWGETHSISIFLILCGLYFSLGKWPGLAWIFIGLAALSRPQMIAPGVILGLILLSILGVRKMLTGLARAVLTMFVALVPFSLRYAPSFPLDLLTSTVRLMGSSNQVVASYFYASFGAFNVWPLVALFTGGHTSLDRFYTPASTPLLGSTYAEIGTVVFLAVVCLLAGAVFFGRISLSAAPLVMAVSLLSGLLFLTSVSNHHFLLVLPLVLLSRRHLSWFHFYSSVVVLSITGLVSVWGDFAVGTSQVEPLVPYLFYQNNPITHFFLGLFRQDWVITLGSELNLLILFLLVAALVRSMRRGNHGRAAASK